MQLSRTEYQIPNLRAARSNRAGSPTNSMVYKAAVCRTASQFWNWEAYGKRDIADWANNRHGGAMVIAKHELHEVGSRVFVAMGDVIPDPANLSQEGRIVY